MIKSLFLAFLLIVVCANCLGQAKDTTAKKKDSTPPQPVFTLSDTTKVFYDLTFKDFQYLTEALNNSNFPHSEVVKVLLACQSSVEKFIRSKSIPQTAAPKQ